MGYRKAEEILPVEVIELIQQYVDGESIYIPRKTDNRKEWGSDTSIRQELEERNCNIYRDYVSGMTVAKLAQEYCLSEKSIQRIVRMLKESNITKSRVGIHE